MNRYFTSVLAAFVVTTLLQAQDGRAMMPRFPILALEDVQKELKLSADQISKIKDIIGDVVKEGPNGSIEMMIQIHPGTDFNGMDVEVSKLLNEKQRQRFKEVWLQSTGGRAIIKDDIAKEIGITKVQQAKIVEMQEELKSQMRELAIQPGEVVKKDAEMKKMQKEWEEKIEKQLTKEQQAKWAAMKGAKFEKQVAKSSPK